MNEGDTRSNFHAPVANNHMGQASPFNALRAQSTRNSSDRNGGHHCPTRAVDENNTPLNADNAARSQSEPRTYNNKGTKQ